MQHLGLLKCLQVQKGLSPIGLVSLPLDGLGSVGSEPGYAAESFLLFAQRTATLAAQAGGSFRGREALRMRPTTTLMSAIDTCNNYGRWVLHIITDGTTKVCV
jgi:hypothetical protein